MGIFEGPLDFNPDYNDNPEVLHGVIKDQLESIGHYNKKVAELEEIETDLNSTIGYLELGVKQWKDQCETANTLLMSANHDVEQYVIFTDKLKDEVLEFQNRAELAERELAKLKST